MDTLMKVQMVLAFAALTAASAFSAATVSKVAIHRNAGQDNVTVDYTLSGGKAVVTVDFLENGDSIGAENFLTLGGDVNQLVEAGDHRIVWTCPERGGDLSGLSARVTAWPVDDPPDYMVIDFARACARRFYVSSNAIPGGVGAAVYKSSSLVMRKIPAKGVICRLGAPAGTENYYPNGQWTIDWRAKEQPHSVKFTDNYYLAIYETTQEQYSRINGNGAVQNPTYPCADISYNTLRGSKDDGIDWPDTLSTVKKGSVIDTLRNRTGLSTFDLPTEAEWEFACRAGTVTSFNNGKNGASFHCALGDLGWDNSNASHGRHPVGEKLCNNWGLYDMHGNVCELCLDWFDETLYKEDTGFDNPLEDPKGPKSSDAAAPTRRSMRSGQFEYGGNSCRSAARDSIDPSQTNAGTKGAVGFRLKCAARAE